MDIVSDASAFLAVALNETERAWVISVSSGSTLIAPDVLHYVLGNAIVAVVKRHRLSRGEALQALVVARSIPVRLVSVDIAAAVELALEVGLYAYDAYYLQCCREIELPLLTLDGPMRIAARRLGIRLVE